MTSRARRTLSMGGNYPVVARAPLLEATTPDVPLVVPEEVIETAVATVLTKTRDQAHLHIAQMANKYPELSGRLWKIFKRMKEEMPATPPPKSRPRPEYDWRVAVANARCQGPCQAD